MSEITYRHDADITVTAWDGEMLVGIARTLTDFSYAAYLADLAVDGGAVHVDWRSL